MTSFDYSRARDCITNALSAMEGFEVPLAAWGVHAAAAKLFENTKNKTLARQHNELSCATILKLANSLTTGESLRRTFLSARDISKIVASAAA
jgi:hypothetical protein